MTRADELRALAERVEAGEWNAAVDTDALPRALNSWGRADQARSAWRDGSLDACAALHKAVLGERWEWSVDGRGGGFVATLETPEFGISRRRGESGGKMVDAWVSTPARAWLAAILRALAEEEGKSDG